jgi:sialate O-acetylesterase
MPRRSTIVSTELASDLSLPTTTAVIAQRQCAGPLNARNSSYPIANNLLALKQNNLATIESGMKQHGGVVHLDDPTAAFPRHAATKRDRATATKPRGRATARLSTALALTAIALVMVAPSVVSAQLRTSRIIGDGMVMQRGAKVPVWGWATAGAKVAVTFDGKPYIATADTGGAWRVSLPSMNAGGPHAMTIASNGQQLQVGDILVGDVWICSGQSNMEWVVANSNDAAQEMASANDPMIRHFKVPQSFSWTPEADLAGGSWEKADPEHVGNFTAVGYFFARDLRKTVKVPIGLINTSWGGSRIEPWMSPRALGLAPAAVAKLEADENEFEQKVTAGLRAKIGDVTDHDPGLVNGTAIWADPALDEAAWSSIEVPKAWEDVGYDGMDGIAWYRTSFMLTPDEARNGITLGLGMIDDSDESWVNGHRVGGMHNAWNIQRRYDVPASALVAGRNVVAVRVEDTGGGGGIIGEADSVFAIVGGTRRPLAGQWKFKVGAISVSSAGHMNQVPTVLWNKMVHPLLPYPIKGALWYQGESNAYPEGAVAYRTQFASMITDWRKSWNVGTFPFLWVQLANYMATDSVPNPSSGWAMLRESQTATLALPKTGEAVIIDIGETNDIHPRNKQDVGARLALAARKVAYGQTLVSSGPTYRSLTVTGNRATIALSSAVGLRTKDGGAPKAFAIAGADKHFVWANATISGTRVVVWSDAVPKPVAVRYAWGDNPLDANLYNAAGLPATPFRTDRW